MKKECYHLHDILEELYSNIFRRIEMIIQQFTHYLFLDWKQKLSANDKAKHRGAKTLWLKQVSRNDTILFEIFAVE